MGRGWPPRIDSEEPCAPLRSRTVLWPTLVRLARRKGYRLVATERVNAFFLRNDVAPAIAAIEARRGYRAPKEMASAQDVFDKLEQAGLPLVTIDDAGPVG